MGTPANPFDSLVPLLWKVAGIKGDFAEFGVLSGQTLLPLAYAAKVQGRECHAVDSFRGMGTPSKRDGKAGGKQFPEGRFNTKGTANLESRIEASELDNVTIWEGFVPEVLKRIKVPRFALVHLDLDHYDPTLTALRWVWPRIAQNGFVAIHDYWLRQEFLAAAAVDTFVKEKGIKLFGRARLTAWLRKP